jgi:hypothetical protein
MTMFTFPKTLMVGKKEASKGSNERKEGLKEGWGLSVCL